MRLIFFTCLYIMFFLSSCTNGNKDCSAKTIQFGKEKYIATGCLINEIEEGQWSFYDNENKLTEKGEYINGIRVGEWHYPKNKIDSIIIWKKYSKENLNLYFNIPELLERVIDSNSYIKFSNQDTSKLFNLVLSVYPINQTGKNIEQYYQQAEEEIKANGWNFSSNKNKITTDSSILYFNEYSIITSTERRFKVLNIYRLVEDNKIFEITCRHDENIENTSRLIFFSLITNTFYKHHRFINPLENIRDFR